MENIGIENKTTILFQTSLFTRLVKILFIHEH